MVFEEGLKEVSVMSRRSLIIQEIWVLDFVDYALERTPKYSVEECKQRDVTYAAPLRVTARLLNKETGEIKQQEIFMGDFPLMTESGTFVINGADVRLFRSWFVLRAFITATATIKP